MPRTLADLCRRMSKQAKCNSSSRLLQNARRAVVFSGGVCGLAWSQPTLRIRDWNGSGIEPVCIQRSASGHSESANFWLK